MDPPRFVWTGSPAGALVVEWLLFGGSHAVRDGVWPVPYERVLADPMWDVVGHELRDSAWAALTAAPDGGHRPRRTSSRTATCSSRAA
jgi:hypothetical protein